MQLLKLQRKSKNWFYLGIGPTYMDKTGRNGIRGDIELEDFKERYRALADKHEAMIAFYDVNIQYNLQN
jgi:adenylosuccinate synthase